MASTFYEWNARGRILPERFFELVHNFPTDYNLYLSRIREGKEGAWMATEKYTSEPHAPSLSQIFYVLVGRLADFSHIQTPYVWFAYHVARIFFGGLLLLVIWKVSKWAFEKAGFRWQLITFLLIATASTWPKFETVAGVPRFGGYMPWYTMADSLQRITFMPHVTFAQAMLVFVLWVFAGGFISRSTGSGQTKHPGNYIFLGIVGLILGIIFPPALLFIYGVLGLETIVECISVLPLMFAGKFARFNLLRLRTWFYRNGFNRLVFGVISTPALIYYTLLLQEYPWKRLAEFDVLHPTKFSFAEYFMAVGPVLPLGILGILILFLLKRWDVLSRLKICIAWIAAWLSFIFIFNRIPEQSPTRFTQMAPNVPLGIFTVCLFYELITLVGELRKSTKCINTGFGRRITYHGKKKTEYFLSVIHNTIPIIPIFIILFAFGTLGSSYMWLQDFVYHKLRGTIPLVPHNAEVMYPMGEIIDGIIWLEVNTPRDAIVLSGMATGNSIPVYSGNTVFIGHANTVRMEDKKTAMENFYTRKFSETDEMSWLKDERIAYVFYSIEEREINGGVDDLRTLYPKLEQVYAEKNTRIYKTPQ